MKAAFFTIAAFVATAFAAPAGVSDAVKTVDDIVSTDLGVKQITDSLSAGSKSSITDSGDVVQALEGLFSGIQTNTGALNSTVASFQKGKISKKEAQTSALGEVENMKFKLSEIVTDLTGAAGLVVAKGDVDKVLNLVVALLAEVLATVKALVTILGITPQLTVALKAVFGIVANLLVLLIGLLAGLLPGLVAALSPLLAALGNGLLAPLLTPIVALLAALAGPGLA
ncbi:hypothetical protein F5B22DRAFT_656967 [Xylaria bambusicola]|uniref:uncharacterized protein n=1 Tax=Xylaria bambusicola TaxID=326684 RepID=UPI002007907D|nr:uncharacterized protein F5B22DRAFT_656967 [Xylaria bambusicola]KAI0513263.1 hypothetical protein F5B22DRAFT_656967 [Xylaria bambusicola]